MLEKPNGVKNVLALKYLENHLNDVKNAPYPLALITYALHLANSTKKVANLTFESSEFKSVFSQKLRKILILAKW